MADRTLIVSIVGIGVSGVVGPLATARAQRRANAQQFALDRQRQRRDELVSIIDEAAQLLAVGATNGRLYAEARDRGEGPGPDVESWAQQVNTHKQRLRLRLPGEHPVVERYEDVRLAAVTVMEGPEVGRDDAINRFEHARDAFLDEGQAVVDAEVARRPRRFWNRD
jgi:hypothetical protein